MFFCMDPDPTLYLNRVRVLNSLSRPHIAGVADLNTDLSTHRFPALEILTSLYKKISNIKQHFLKTTVLFFCFGNKISMTSLL